MLVAERQIAEPERDFEHWIKETSEKTVVYNPRNWEWRCPLCKEKVIYVQEASDGTIQHFRHKNSKNHPSISEGRKHEQSKKKIKEKIENKNNTKNTELEKIIGAYPDNYQVADIFLETKKGEKIAVEIQISSQSVDDFKERTKFYNKNNISVLWLVGKENYTYEKTSRRAIEDDTIVFKEAVKWLQRNYYGRVYIIDTEKIEVIPYRLTRKEVVNEGGLNYPTYKKRLKTVAEYSTGNIPNYGLTCTATNGYKIARFYDKCWWK